MRSDMAFRVGVFRDVERARRVVEEARANGFTHISVVADDPNVRESFRQLCEVRGCDGAVHRPPAQVSRMAALVGAAIGLVAGFGGVLLFRRYYGPPGAIMNVSIPLAGVIWGAFVAAMVSRGWQGSVENFFDQELLPGELLVAIEDNDPMRLALAERILRGVGVVPMPLAPG